jgi:hypothetical protein
MAVGGWPVSVASHRNGNLTSHRDNVRLVRWIQDYLDQHGHQWRFVRQAVRADAV